MTTTVTTGQYKYCPINRLPTGYICWCVDNDTLKPHHKDFYRELTARIFARREPTVDETLLAETWFDDWDDKTQRQYVSMMTDGQWQWTGNTKTAVVQAKLLEGVYLKLHEEYTL